MAKFCTRCGKQLSETALFCTECGNKVEQTVVQKAIEAIKAPDGEAVTEQLTQNVFEEVIPTQEIPVAEPVDAPEQPVYQPPVPEYAPAEQPPQETDDKPTGKYAPTSVLAFFGMLLLFTIPVVGWIACLVMCFAAKKQNTKNFARAIMIWTVIGAFLVAAVISAFMWAFSEAIDYIEDAVGVEFEVTNGSFDLDEFLEQFKDAQNAKRDEGVSKNQ